MQSCCDSSVCTAAQDCTLHDHRRLVANRALYIPLWLMWCVMFNVRMCKDEPWQGGLHTSTCASCSQNMLYHCVYQVRTPDGVFTARTWLYFSPLLPAYCLQWWWWAVLCTRMPGSLRHWCGASSGGEQAPPPSASCTHCACTATVCQATTCTWWVTGWDPSQR